MDVLSINYGYIPTEIGRPMSVWLDLHIPATHKLSLREFYYLSEEGTHDINLSPYLNRPFIIDDIIGKRIVIKFLDSANYKKIAAYRADCINRQMSVSAVIPFTSMCTCGDNETPICKHTSVVPSCTTRLLLNRMI